MTDTNERLSREEYLNLMACYTPARKTSNANTEDDRDALREEFRHLQLKVKEFAARLERLESKMDEAIAAANIARQASDEWDLKLADRGSLVFANKAGRIVKFPPDVARSIAEGRPLDLDIEPRGDSLVLKRGGTIVAEAPLSLISQIKGTPCWCRRNQDKPREDG